MFFGKALVTLGFLQLTSLSNMSSWRISLHCSKPVILGLHDKYSSMPIPLYLSWLIFWTTRCLVVCLLMKLSVAFAWLPLPFLFSHIFPFTVEPHVALACCLYLSSTSCSCLASCLDTSRPGPSCILLQDSSLAAGIGCSETVWCSVQTSSSLVFY